MPPDPLTPPPRIINNKGGSHAGPEGRRPHCGATKTVTGGAVRQGGDGAARGAGDDAQGEVGTDAQGPAGPVVLREARGQRGKDHDVGAVALRFGGGRGEGGDLGDCRGRERMDGRVVEERALCRTAVQLPPPSRRNSSSPDTRPPTSPSATTPPPPAAPTPPRRSSPHSPATGTTTPASPRPRRLGLRAYQRRAAAAGLALPGFRQS